MHFHCDGIIYFSKPVFWEWCQNLKSLQALEVRANYITALSHTSVFYIFRGERVFTNHHNLADNIKLQTNSGKRIHVQVYETKNGIILQWMKRLISGYPVSSILIRN